ncbi:Eco57I restriction-modification methylase domain-containing protein [bacterium]|nr:Eco57I restriction-modification methylase domain-containing protein [bacterium]
MFIYFVQKKQWLKWDNSTPAKSYMKELWLKYKNSKFEKDTFYSVWLSNLFFSAFNGKHDYLNSELPEEIKKSFELMPFLNGGLFHRNELDKLDFEVSDAVFEWLFEPEATGNDNRKGFLEIYNFTINESLPYDVEVAVDPEMIGKVYESLIFGQEQETSGIFYTPRVEIDFMCRLSLVEYLVENTGIPKNEILPLIFEPDRIENFSSIEKLKEIKTSLDKVKIVDPACGSGSFLVGMMNILVELHTALARKLENKEKNIFALKQQIVLKNLYGVDVKGWAVMVAELRLWLSLIIETDERYMDIHTRPLLPNLSFKIRQGDSLVEEIAGVNITLRNQIQRISQSIKKKIIELIDKKSAYFREGQSSTLKEQGEIENLEHEIFMQIAKERVEELIFQLENKREDLKLLKQGIVPDKEGYSVQFELFARNEDIENLFAKKYAEEVKIEIEEMQKELEKYNRVFKNLKKEKNYFLWEIDFVEVFAERGGFDIVIGNPPYVRQEKIAYPLEREEDYKPDEWRKRKSEYKNKLVESVKLQWGDFVKIPQRSDLYVYFYYHGLSLLRPKGIFCFINSNSWLDVGYGTELQEFLLKQMQPLYIIDNAVKRVFARADINTVIVLIRRPEDVGEISDDDVLKFIAFKKPFEQVIKPEILLKIEKESGFKITEDYRVFPKTRMELIKEGTEIPDEGELDFEDVLHLPYKGNKWGGKYLRAPDIYFTILEKGKDKLVRLGDIAEVRFGIKTGANEFFYVEDVTDLIED